MIGPMAHPQRVATSTKGMVASQHWLATEAGVEILTEGGNAFDAAVAVALALGVCEPNASGLGGQSMALLHRASPKRTVFVDGSSRAPSRAVAEVMNKKQDRFRGYAATTIPSTPAMLAHVARAHGSLPWARLIEPAIRIAEDGYPISELQRRLQVREESHWPDGNAGAVFLKDGQPFEIGDTFKQPALAMTLRRLAEVGVEDFYLGDIAARIADDMEANEGLIQRDDLAHVPWPIERRPISGNFEGLRVMTCPPPAAGRTLIEMLNVLSHFSDQALTTDTPRGALLLAEVIRRAQLDRRDRPYDPNLYPQIDDKHMTGREYAKLVAKQVKARVRPKKGVAPSLDPGGEAPPAGHGETTHFSIMDQDGNVVAWTQSIERAYGSFVATPDLGFPYNNYMSAFEFKDYTHPYYLRPNGVPWASVVPTIVFKGRKPWLVLGSPGSERITSTVLQILLRLRSEPPLNAVIAPRIHCSARGKVALEAAWLRDDIPPFLEMHGFTIDRREPFAFYMGAVQLVLWEGKRFIGVGDPRRDGSAGGPGK
jgi:gamma-glutamyltranspeptidase / glutathione hydrolase